MNLKQKIQNTKFFSDKEKIAILVDIDNYDENTKLELEKAIDDYNQSLIALTQNYKKDLTTELEKIQNEYSDNQEVKNAVSRIKEGLDIIIPNAN